MLYTVRAATGGFIVEVVDEMEEATTDEIVFVSKDGALEFLRDVLGPDREDPVPKTGAAG